MSYTASEKAPEIPLTAQEAFDSIGSAYEDAFSGLIERKKL